MFYMKMIYKEKTDAMTNLYKEIENMSSEDSSITRLLSFESKIRTFITEQVKNFDFELIPRYKWDCLWNSTQTIAGNKRKNHEDQVDNKPPRKPKYDNQNEKYLCKRWNWDKTCFNAPCNYSHACMKCLKTGHPAIRCPLNQ
jgi:hypothetical protein